MTIQQLEKEINQFKTAREGSKSYTSLNIEKSVAEITERNIRNLLNPPTYRLNDSAITFADAISDFSEEDRIKIAQTLGQCCIQSERLFEVSHGGWLKQVGYISTYSQANIFSQVPAALLANEILKPDYISPFFESFLCAIKNIDDAYLKRNYRKLFMIVDKPNRLPLFNMLFDEITQSLSPNEFMELFSLIYMHNEYNFENMDMEAIASVLARTDRNIHLIKDNLDDDGYCTIYRGEATKSTHIKYAYSWSLFEDVALRFATRFQANEDDTANRFMHKARIHVDKIILYIISTEKEALVNYEDLIDIETTPLNEFYVR